MISRPPDELTRRANAYVEARRAQQLDHTDPTLDDARTEAHDALMMQLDIEGVHYGDREDAARIAMEMIGD